MFVVLFAHTVTVLVDAAAITPTPPPTVRPANTPTTSITATELREYDRDIDKRLMGGAYITQSPPFHTNFVPKNAVSRSKSLLKPRPLPHQHWGSEVRTELLPDNDNRFLSEHPVNL